MPPTFAAIDHSTIKALRKDDAGALEKIFRADYDAMIHESVKVLGEPEGAPLVVQNAIAQVWDERKNIETADELEKALRDAVSGHARREQRRRASQQGKPAANAPAGPKNADEVWTRVKASISAPKADAGPKHHAVDPSRPHATVHMGEVGKRSMAGPIVGGVLLIAVSGGLLYWMNRKGEATAVDRSFSSPKVSIASSAAAQRSGINLSDSTRIKIGPESKVIVPPGFGEVGTGRIVKLEGTANFTVVPSETMPFEVRAGTFALVAMGTDFTVRAYANEDVITVRVKEGKVVVKGAAESRTVAAGGALTIAKDGSVKEPPADEVGRATAWTDGRFVVANMTLKALLPELKRWFPLDPSVKDQALLDRTVSLDVSLDSTKATIAALEKAASVKFTYDGVKQVLTDAGAPAKK